MRSQNEQSEETLTMEESLRLGFTLIAALVAVLILLALLVSTTG